MIVWDDAKMHPQPMYNQTRRQINRIGFLKEKRSTKSYVTPFPLYGRESLPSRLRIQKANLGMKQGGNRKENEKALLLFELYITFKL